MKKSINIIAVCLSAILYSCGDTPGKDQDTSKAKTEVVDGISISSFKVWGNCGMCEDKIEGSLKANGVKDADWNSETKMIKVSYDSTLISLDSLHKRIAVIGYDTEKYKSRDSTYSNLHECCQYDRK